jgi:hypothetical protein
VTDLTLQTLIEFRGEMREFRDETRKALAQQDHRLNLLTEQMRDQSHRLAQLEIHMAALRTSTLESTSWQPGSRQWKRG